MVTIKQNNSLKCLDVGPNPLFVQFNKYFNLIVKILFQRWSLNCYQSDSGKEDSLAPPLVGVPDRHVVVVQDPTPKG